MNNHPIIKEIAVPVPVNSVWKAITDPTQMKEWYFNVHNFKLEVSNEFYFYEPGNAKKFRHVCTITEIIPNKKFSHTWTFPDYSEGVSNLAWELTEESGNTRIRLTHEGVENFAEAGSDFARASFDAGWQEIVTQILVNYLIQ